MPRSAAFAAAAAAHTGHATASLTDGLAHPFGLDHLLAMLAVGVWSAAALPLSVGLVSVAAAASLHGLAHGAELRGGASFTAYAAGFLLVTALLHAAGLGLGRLMLRLQSWVWRLAGAGLGAAGLLLITRL